MDIFYDFDGTLFDTYPGMVEAFDLACRDFNVKINRNDLYNTMRTYSLGKAIRDISHEYGLDERELKQHYEDYEMKLVKHARPFGDAEELLMTVKKNKGRNFLLTHRKKEAISILESFNLRDLFDDFITGSQSFPRKPDPASLNYLIDKYQVNKKSAYMIGDRNLDIDAAHNADIKGILFDPDNLIEDTSNPEFRSNDFKTIIAYLFK